MPIFPRRLEFTSSRWPAAKKVAVLNAVESPTIGRYRVATWSVVVKSAIQDVNGSRIDCPRVDGLGSSGVLFC